MKSGLIIVRFVMFAFAIGAIAHAEDKNGIRLSVTKRTLERADDGPSRSYSQSVHRKMALKAAVQNISMGKDLPDAKVSSIVIIRTWTSSETGSFLRYTNTAKMEPLKKAAQAELNVGEFLIGGHLHGTLEHHVDQVAAWKITFDHGGKVTEFVSSTSFDALDKRARDAVKTSTAGR